MATKPTRGKPAPKKSGNINRNSQLVAALETAWGHIQKRHPDLPGAVIVVASGSEGAGTLKLGHWAAGRWEHGKGKKKTATAEMLISGEGLKLGAADVLGTMLHEAAHALATARGVKDTSRDGRYHNAVFKALAGEVGLTVYKHKTRGWSETHPALGTLKKWGTLKKYEKTVAMLTKAIQGFRTMEPAGVQKKPSRLRLAMCECERKLRLSLSAFQEGPITCGNCEQVFQLEATWADLVPCEETEVA